jgi:hypothetical protein
VDGVIEINQASAVAGGVNGSLATDPPGFPVVITAPGSYRLTSSLSAPEFLSAITITANQVTLDLNGFRVSTQLPAGGVHGINAVGRTDIRLSNGAIEGFGGAGIQSGDRARIENVSASNNGGVGILVGHLSTVIGNSLNSNGSHGIQTGEVCTISNNIVELSAGGGAGIYSPGRSTVTGNKVNANSGPGIEVGGSSTASDNVSTYNTGNGIRAGEGSTVRQNTVSSNSGDGIKTDSGCTVIHNTVRNNSGDGIEVGAQSAVIGNAVSGNTRCGLNALSCLNCVTGFAHNVFNANNGSTTNRQVSGGERMDSSNASSDVINTNVCSGFGLTTISCSGGTAANCP